MKQNSISRVWPCCWLFSSLFSSAIAEASKDHPPRRRSGLRPCRHRLRKLSLSGRLHHGFVLDVLHQSQRSLIFIDLEANRTRSQSLLLLGPILSLQIANPKSSLNQIRSILLFISGTFFRKLKKFMYCLSYIFFLDFIC